MPIRPTTWTPFEFVVSDAGLPEVIEFMNLWARGSAPHPGLHGRALRGPARRGRRRRWRRCWHFSAPPGTDAQVADAVEFASYDNMKRMEQQRVFWLSGGRLVPKDRSNPNSYKVRRGKVAGYRDDFNATQLAEIDRLVQTTLDPLYGYTGAARPADKGALEGAA